MARGSPTGLGARLGEEGAATAEIRAGHEDWGHAWARERRRQGPERSSFGGAARGASWASWVPGVGGGGG